MWREGSGRGQGNEYSFEAQWIMDECTHFISCQGLDGGREKGGSLFRKGKKMCIINMYSYCTICSFYFCSGSYGTPSLFSNSLSPSHEYFPSSCIVYCSLVILIFASVCFCLCTEFSVRTYLLFPLVWKGKLGAETLTNSGS